jgi:cytochrome c-type biogenesis protein CcmE
MSGIHICPEIMLGTIWHTEHNHQEISWASLNQIFGSLDMAFVVTDFKHDVKVRYSGVVPDLFRENQGVVAHGRLGSDGVFVADEILAKHDENYMPPEVARSLKDKHGGVMPAKPDSASVGSPASAPVAPATRF